MFSGVGFVAFVYGKKTQQFGAMVLGGALMLFPYFVTGAAMVWLVGLFLTGALFYFRE